jgi:hypothetical protein
MREIRFRFWDKIHKFMCSSNDIFLSSMGQIYTSTFHGTRTNITEQFIIMQYTGLKDKNGKEIYEGDILVNPDHKNDDGYMPSTVRWVETQYTVGFDFGTAPAARFAEIIGNIYENKELLDV